ncbi:Ras gtp binding protein d [Fasciola hepatica]|uniref:Ras gtp binding protein d n=1 Tax=Fasciola hepatica TaxID=6192 RepID=A0A4E0R2U6_FASHE|nr:Ras gtp binding protein d [Fasciola hepatica]
MLQENRGYAGVGSFLPPYSTEFGYGLGPDTLLQNPPRMESDVGEKPKILLMGLRRSGKSSIQKVVFHKMAPNETLFLESTHKIEKNDVSECSFIKFQIWDFPGHVNFCDEMFRSDEIFLASCAIIFIVDAQDDYHEALCYLHTTLETAFRHNTNIKFEVFIHKVDCLNDDQKIDIQRDITQRVTSAVEDLLSEHGAAGGISIGFHLTTIYDHSIFEAFSKVVQKLIPHLDAFEHLLNIFIAKSMVDKAFLFDVTSKIYLATDSSGVDMQTYELCCDMIDVVVDMAAIYTPRSDLADTAFSEPTGATITLNNDRVLYLRGVNQYMALACIIHEESLEKIGLIEYNFHVIKDGLQKMLELNQRHEKDDTEAAARCINSEHPPDRALIAGDENDLEDEDEDENEDNHGDPNRPSVRRSRDLGPLLH